MAARPTSIETTKQLTSYQQGNGVSGFVTMIILCTHTDSHPDWRHRLLRIRMSVAIVPPFTFISFDLICIPHSFKVKSGSSGAIIDVRNLKQQKLSKKSVVDALFLAKFHDVLLQEQ